MSQPFLQRVSVTLSFALNSSSSSSSAQAGTKKKRAKRKCEKCCSTCKKCVLSEYVYKMSSEADSLEGAGRCGWRLA